MIYPDEAYILSGMSDEFKYVFTASINSESNLGEGSLSGGMPIFFRSSLNLSLKRVHKSFYFHCLSYLLIIKFTFILLCDMRSTEIQVLYEHVLGKFQCTLNDLKSNKPLALGDYNADPTRTRI